jgi:hypothetical protein
VVSAYSSDQLAHATLRRQFPPVRSRGAPDVVELIRRVGPIQSQVARSTFVAVAARLPGATYETINAVHESHEIVRGSNIRGTVHSCVSEQHPLLDAITRRTLARQWRLGLRLTRVEPDEVRHEMESFATGDWRTPAELRGHLVGWLSEHESADSVEAARTPGVGQSMAHGHSALIRRPVTGRAWDRQTAPGYRVAADVLGEPPSPWLDDPDGALVALTRQHLSAFGPANRRDVAWWSGGGLRSVDAALETLAEELTERPGPDGQTYYDLLERQPDGDGDPGVRLLPEYDAVVLGYDPKSRDRFLAPEELGYVWNPRNGGFAAFVLADGRVRGAWRLVGTGPDRSVEVRPFPGQRLAEADFSEPVLALETALDCRVTDVRLLDTASFGTRL